MHCSPRGTRSRTRLRSSRSRTEARCALDAATLAPYLEELGAPADVRAVGPIACSVAHGRSRLRCATSARASAAPAAVPAPALAADEPALLALAAALGVAPNRRRVRDAPKLHQGGAAGVRRGPPARGRRRAAAAAAAAAPAPAPARRRAGRARRRSWRRSARRPSAGLWHRRFGARRRRARAAHALRRRLAKAAGRRQHDDRGAAGVYGQPEDGLAVGARGIAASGLSRIA